MSLTTNFDEHKHDCPWNEEGNCKGTYKVWYNQHVSDQRDSIDECEENICPFFYWATIKEIP